MKFTEIPYFLLKAFFSGAAVSPPAEEDTNTYYTITSSVLSGSGTVDILGAVRVVEGGSATFYFYPANLYEVKEVFVDNVSIGAVSEYTFTNVTENHTISVIFSEIYVISVTYYEGGSVTGEIL